MWGSQLTGRKEHWCPGTQESWHGDGIGTRLPVFQSQLYPSAPAVYRPPHSGGPHAWFPALLLPFCNP